jgi:hypothetical protein
MAQSSSSSSSIASRSSGTTSVVERVRVVAVVSLSSDAFWCFLRADDRVVALVAVVAAVAGILAALFCNDRLFLNFEERKNKKKRACGRAR